MFSDNDNSIEISYNLKYFFTFTGTVVNIASIGGMIAVGVHCYESRESLRHFRTLTFNLISPYDVALTVVLLI